MSTLERSQYENPAMWQENRYLGNADELRRFEACARLIPAEACSIVDVGTGNAAFLKFLGRVRPQLRSCGADRSFTAIRFDVARRPLVQGSSDALPFRSGSADVVSALEVIEHLPLAVFSRTLEELERVSAKYVLISVPYHEPKVMAKCPSCECEFNPHYHLRRFDKNSLESLMPTFQCVGLMLIHKSDVWFASSVGAVYRRIRTWAGFFPAYTTCPLCGFSRNNGSAGDAYHAVARSDTAMRLGRAARHVIPRRSRAAWAVGLYQKPDSSSFDGRGPLHV